MHTRVLCNEAHTEAGPMHDGRALGVAKGRWAEFGVIGPRGRRQDGLGQDVTERDVAVDFTATTAYQRPVGEAAN